MTNLYGRLFRYRTREHRAPLEDYLSEALVDLLERMPREAVIELLATMLPSSGAALVDHLGGEGALQWSTQRHVADERRGYVDILLEIGGFPILIIENKLGSGIRDHGQVAGDADRPALSRNQLSTYGTWIARRADPDWGGALILLTHTTSPPGDFLDPAMGGYGVLHRGVFTWPMLARWLTARLSLPPREQSRPSWQILASDFIEFLKEQNMVAETVSVGDIASLQVFLPSAQRLFATFQRAWSAAAATRQDLCSNRISKVDFRSDAGIVWNWSYTRSPPAPPSSYLALGLRFPEQSDWWKDAPLPTHPHAFLMIGSDYADLPMQRVAALPPGWLKLDEELVAAIPLQSFPATTDEFATAFVDWVQERSGEAVQLVRAMSR